MSNFDKIFERAKLATKTRTQMELATLLGIRQSSISDAKRRNSVPADWYMKLFESYNLNPFWLKYGAGPMYLHVGGSYVEPEQAPASCENAAPHDGQNARGIVVSVHAGQEYYDPESPAVSIGYLSIPLPFMRSGLYVIRFDASSMEPFVRKGAYVGLDTRQQSLLSGELYGVNMPHEGIVIRRIYIDSPNGNMVLKSENPAHPEITLPIAEQRDRVVGLVCWIMQRF